MFWLMAFVELVADQIEEFTLSTKLLSPERFIFCGQTVRLANDFLPEDGERFVGIVNPELVGHLAGSNG